MDLKDFEGQGQVASIFAMHLPDIIDSHPEIRILTADMSYGARLERFKALYPEKFINVGIAEQNLIGVAAGLSSEGYTCVALAQAAFITMRDFEQVRQYMSYMGFPIVLIGLSAGLGMQFMGNTHYALEDMAIMRSLPNVEVLCPADAGEAVLAFDYAISFGHPVYIRLTGMASDRLVYEKEFSYNPNRANVLREGTDITLFATGSMVSRALDAADIVADKAQVTVRVVDVHAISPFDRDIVKSASSKLLVSVEEHYTANGLGSQIADVMVEEGMNVPLLKLGIQNRYSLVGEYVYLLEQHRLTQELIAEDIISKYHSL